MTKLQQVIGAALLCVAATFFGSSAHASRADVRCAPSQSKQLMGELSALGTVTYDQDRYAVIGPLVNGRVAALRAKEGSRVHVGQALADVESPEVGAARAQFIASKARARASAAHLKRETELSQKHVSAERSREMAAAQAVEEQALFEAAAQQLRAYGLFSDDMLQVDPAAGGRIQLRSPIAGIVISRRITLGQAIERGTDAFVVADLSRLWVLLDLYEIDMERIHVGQRAELHSESLPNQAMFATVSYIEPVINVSTRTAKVRVEFDNKQHLLHPGQFVNATIFAERSKEAAVVLSVPKEAIQTQNGKAFLYTCEPSGTYVRREVVLGISDATHSEIRSGLSEGENVVVQGAFYLKSSMEN